MFKKMNGGLLATLLLLLGTISGSALTLNGNESGGSGDKNNVAGTGAVERVSEMQQAQNAELSYEKNLTNKEESSLLLEEKTAVCLSSEVVKHNAEVKSLSHALNVTEGDLATIIKKSPNLARSGPQGKLATEQKITSS